MNTDILNDPEMQRVVNQGRTASKNSGASTGDLTQLCNYGVLQEPFTIGPYTFVVRTLKSGEQEKCLAAIAQYNITTLVAAVALQNQVLSRAIVSINGVPLEKVPYDRDSIEDKDLLTRADNGDVRSRKLAAVFSLPEGLRQQLFQFQQDLSAKSEDMISGVEAEDLKE